MRLDRWYERWQDTYVYALQLTADELALLDLREDDYELLRQLEREDDVPGLLLGLWLITQRLAEAGRPRKK